VDLLVEDCVVVELKSVEKLAPVHKKQVLTYYNLNPSASPRLRVNQNQKNK
ncbi:MAG: GxxExxY protein, partial [Opitutae bacterium]|nr:GxxExxY protein [Opitutae bacterium]